MHKFKNHIIGILALGYCFCCCKTTHKNGVVVPELVIPKAPKQVEFDAFSKMLRALPNIDSNGLQQSDRLLFFSLLINEKRDTTVLYSLIPISKTMCVFEPNDTKKISTYQNEMKEQSRTLLKNGFEQITYGNNENLLINIYGPLLKKIENISSKLPEPMAKNWGMKASIYNSTNESGYYQILLYGAIQHQMAQIDRLKVSELNESSTYSLFYILEDNAFYDFDNAYKGTHILELSDPTIKHTRKTLTALFSPQAKYRVYDINQQYLICQICSSREGNSASYHTKTYYLKKTSKQ